MYSLGRVYDDGDGVVVDFKRAAEWFERAAKNGKAGAAKEAEAARAKYRAAQEESPEVPALTVDEAADALGDDDEAEEALRWYADHGVAEAQYKLAVATLVYGSTDVPEEEAAGYCTQAAAQGHRAAQELLGECYTDENGVSFSAERAFYWFGKAAAQGDPFSQNKLGDCYFDGEGVKQSFEKAAEWYKKAAIQGESEAMFSLGYLYENGKGTDRDYSEALRWYKMAQARGDGDAAAAIARVEQLIKDHPEYDG